MLAMILGLGHSLENFLALIANLDTCWHLFSMEFLDLERNIGACFG